MTDRELMQAAIALAREAAADGEVPVGAVVTRNGEIVSVGRNRREKDKNALAHAEIEAIDRACKALGGWRLWECELDDSVVVWPPFFTDSGKNTHVGSRVFINAGCQFQDQGGIWIEIGRASCRERV